MREDGRERGRGRRTEGARVLEGGDVVYEVPLSITRMSIFATSGKRLQYDGLGEVYDIMRFLVTGT